VIHPARHGTARPGGQRAGAPAGGRAPASAYRRPAGRTAGPGQAGPGQAGPGQAGPGQAGRPGARSAVRLTSRGAVLAMAMLFFLGTLAAAGLGWSWLAGAAFVAGSGAAARYTNPRDLLAVTVSPPLLFLCALILARALTANGHLLVSVAEGTLLTLAGVAPWLFAGVALNLAIALARGLPECVRQLRRDLRGIAAGRRDGRQSLRATPQYSQRDPSLSASSGSSAPQSPA
jgi:hypothetical protein